MADLQVEIRYRPPVLRGWFLCIDIYMWIMHVIVPIAALAAVGAAVIANGLSLAYDVRLQNILALLLMYLLVSLAGLIVRWPLRDFSIRVSKDGLVIPTLLARWQRIRTNIIWPEIKESTIIGSGGQEKLVFQLDSKRTLKLSLASFKKDEVEQLLLGTELWGTATRRSPELIDYQCALQNDLRGVEGRSYTQMWEQELNHRFGHTNFLPLDPGHQLQNQTLTVVRQLAFGGLSAIYLAQKNNQDLFVLKEAVVPANADIQIRRQAEKQFAREAQLLAAIDHGNIAKVFDYFVEAGRTYILLEYINGQDLRQFVRQNGPQPVRRVIDWGLILCEALEYLHAADPPIVHRDFTPDNIVLSTTGALVVIDFGAANEFIGTATGTLIGKQAYIAPEQLRGKATCQSDLYALGATLYFLLTARDPKPLAACSPQAVLSDLPTEIDCLVQELTAVHTRDRVLTAADTRQRLLALARLV